MKIGYARVSREEQNADLQHDALKAAGCEEIFEDKLTGATMKRPGLDQALARLQAGDELVVWKFDRFGRSMLETLLLVLDLEKRGIRFRSLNESFDTSTPIGRGVLAFMAAMAEDEHASIIKRTRAGMAAAKRRGVVIGRPKKLTPHQIEHARELIVSEKETQAGAAALLGVDVTTLRRALNRGFDTVVREFGARQSAERTRTHEAATQKESLKNDYQRAARPRRRGLKLTRSWKDKDGG